ncbi:MAG: ATP-binding protein [Chloroflexi bacterium]|nr:ATP-binding protein [Chloroflexota bacterium]
MKVVVASGKGGTGKTLVATSLALVAQELGQAVLLDADVEAPNAALFLRPEIERRYAVERWVPAVDERLCTHCGRCAEVCQYHAIAALPQKTLVFDELCHGCGSCALNCPIGAIQEQPKALGWIESGHANGLAFAQGILQVGEAMATPVIRALKRHALEMGWDQNRWLVLDAPPGTACPVIEALRGADVALLVTEPTPFGLHDLQLAVQVARDALHLPIAVVLNKEGAGDRAVEAYCAQEGLPILLRIPLEREIAIAYSNGRPLVDALPTYRPGFTALLDLLLGLAGGSSS